MKNIVKNIVDVKKRAEEVSTQKYLERETRKIEKVNLILFQNP